MKPIDIGAVANATGFAVSTLRYYEQKGLICSTGRHGLRRYFDRSVLQTLAVIALGKEAGLSLDEIGSMLKPGGTLAIDRAGLQKRADELDRAIAALAATSKALRHVAACPASDHLECPSFRRLVGIASRRHRAQGSQRRTADRTRSGRLESRAR